MACRGDGVASDGEVAKVAVDLEVAAGDLYAPASEAKVGDSPDVQTIAAWRNLNVGVGNCGKERCGPRCRSAVLEAVIDVDADDAVAVKDEAETDAGVAFDCVFVC